MITSKIVNDIKIAIVIPAHNEASTIMDCLTSVQLAIEQLPSTIIAYPLVVLDSCTDETLSLIRSAQVEYKIEYLTCDYRCVGRVRDLGLCHAIACLYRCRFNGICRLAHAANGSYSAAADRYDLRGSQCQ